MPYKDSEKQKEYKKKYYQENKEQIKENVKKRQKENPDKAREWSKKYYQENKEKINAASKKYYEKNKEKMKERSKKYYQENIEKQKEYHQNYREHNREKAKETSKLWREKPENKERALAWRRKYRSKRYHTDPAWKLRDITRRRVLGALKEGKGGESILPYVDWDSYEELKEHLESQFEDWMTWDNHGVWHPTERRWHIDHIKPQSVLLEGVETMDDPKFRECWALENLRPLEARENLSKGNKIIDE